MTNEEKINCIHEQYGTAMYQKANGILRDSYEAEDAVQEALLRLFGIADRIEDPMSARTKALALTVAKNIAIDMWRKKTRAVPTEDVYLEQTPDTASTEQIVTEKDGFANLIQTFFNMPDSCRDVLKLRCVYEFSADETARLLGTNANTVNIRLTRARKMLKTRYAALASLVVVCGLGVVLRTWQLTGFQLGTASGSAAPASATVAASYDTEHAEHEKNSDIAAFSAENSAEGAQEGSDAESSQPRSGEDAGTSAAKGALENSSGSDAQTQGEATQAENSSESGSSVNESSNAAGESAHSSSRSSSEFQAASVISDSTEGGVRSVGLLSGTQTLRLLIADSEDALTGALSDAAYDETAPVSVWHTAVGSSWVEIRILNRTDQTGAAAFWKTGGLFYALRTDQTSEAALDTLCRTAADYADYGMEKDTADSAG